MGQKAESDTRDPQGRQRQMGFLGRAGCQLLPSQGIWVSAVSSPEGPGGSPGRRRVHALLEFQDGLSKQFNVAYFSCGIFVILMSILSRQEYARRARYCYTISVCLSVCPSRCGIVSIN